MKLISRLNVDITNWLRWSQALTPLIILIFLILLLLLSGCAGDYLVVRPDVHISGDFGPPRWRYSQPYYGPFWEYSVLTVVNGSTRCEMREIIQDGVIRGQILPGGHLRLLIKNYYNESRQVSMVAVAYCSGRFAGTIARTFSFYGSTYYRQSETWQITDRDIRGRDP